MTWYFSSTFFFFYFLYQYFGGDLGWRHLQSVQSIFFQDELFGELISSWYGVFSFEIEIEIGNSFVALRGIKIKTNYNDIELSFFACEHSSLISEN